MADETSTAAASPAAAFFQDFIVMNAAMSDGINGSQLHLAIGNPPVEVPGQPPQPQPVAQNIVIPDPTPEQVAAYKYSAGPNYTKVRVTLSVPPATAA